MQATCTMLLVRENSETLRLVSLGMQVKGKQQENSICKVHLLNGDK